MRRDEDPAALLGHKLLLSPVKLTVMILLDRHLRLPAAEVRKILGIPWGTFESHMTALENAGYIEARRMFVRSAPRIVLSRTPAGAAAFNQLRDVLRVNMWQEE